ncbi:MAG: aminoacyl-tRNA hydrolase [Pseudomonadota bacterium]
MVLDRLIAALSAVFGGQGSSLSAEAPVQIFIGQGNPGAKYADNRHNLGFMALDRIADTHGFGPWRSKFQGEVSEGRISDVKVLLLKPQTFYNETGRSLSEALRFFKLSAEDVTVFHDEIDLAPGRIRTKQGGGHSGNNGMRSIIAHVGADVRRVRMGIGHPGDRSRVMPYVLSDFPSSETTWRDALLDAISRSVSYLVDGDDERFQTDVLRLAPAPKSDPRKSGPEG